MLPFTLESDQVRDGFPCNGNPVAGVPAQVSRGWEVACDLHSAPAQNCVRKTVCRRSLSTAVSLYRPTALHLSPTRTAPKTCRGRSCSSVDLASAAKQSHRSEVLRSESTEVPSWWYPGKW